MAGILTELTPAEGWGLGSGSGYGSGCFGFGLRLGPLTLTLTLTLTLSNPNPNPNPNPITPAEEARVPRSSWERFLLVLRPLEASTASASAFFA